MPPLRIVYDPDPRAGSLLFRDTKSRWIWQAHSYAPLEGDRYLAVLHPNGRLSGSWTAATGTYYAYGTLVRGQRAGIGTLLWCHLIAAVSPKRVSVDTVTDGGHALIARMRRAFPAISWSVSDMR